MSDIENMLGSEKNVNPVPASCETDGLFFCSSSNRSDLWSISIFNCVKAFNKYLESFAFP